MRCHLSFAVFSIALLAAHEAPAAVQLANVSGFDAALLAGRTCQGIFSSGRKHSWSQGAVELRFAVEGDRLTAQFARLIGQAGYDREAYALTQRRAADASGYDHLGMVRDLTVMAGVVRYTDPAGGRATLTYRAGTLSGQNDPRSGTDPRLTRIQFVNLQCR